MSEGLFSRSAPSRLLLRVAAPVSGATTFRSISILVRLPRRRLDFIATYHACSSSTVPLDRSPVAAAVAATAWSGVEGNPSSEELTDEDAPTSIELVPVVSEEQFDWIITEAQQIEDFVIFLWMADWCRKCIYLKPKLEKLAADYYPRICFYCVDVNKVPQKLVKRAGITLWRGGEKQAEVIGGHQAWLVVDDVRRMIENED